MQLRPHVVEVFLQCSIEEGLLAIIGSKSWSLLVNCQHEYSPTKPWTDKKWTGSSCYCAQSSVNESEKSQVNISRSVRGSTHNSCTCKRQGWLKVNLKALKTITAWLSYPAGNQRQLLFQCTSSWSYLFRFWPVHDEDPKLKSWLFRYLCVMKKGKTGNKLPLLNLYVDSISLFVSPSWDGQVWAPTDLSSLCWLLATPYEVMNVHADTCRWWNGVTE